MSNARKILLLFLLAQMCYWLLLYHYAQTIEQITLWGTLVVFTLLGYGIVAIGAYRESQQVERKPTRTDRLRANGGKHTDLEWYQLCATYGWKCARCGVKTKLTRDHILPVSKGGSDNIANIQPLCRSCNSSKATKQIRY